MSRKEKQSPHPALPLMGTPYKLCMSQARLSLENTDKLVHLEASRQACLRPAY